MALTAGYLVGDEQTLATTLTRIDFGDHVRLAWFSCPSTDCYLVYDNALDDLGAVPASARFTIPAGTVFPIYNRGKRPLVAALSGTPVASVVGEPD